MNPLTDPLLWIAVVSRVLLVVAWRSPLQDGYHVVDRLSPWQWEEIYVFVTLLPDTYILSWVTVLLVGAGGTPIHLLNVVDWTLVLGVLLAVRFSVSYWKTLQRTGSLKGTLYRLLLFPVSVVFGVGGSTFLVTVAHPNPQVVEFLYQYHVNISLARLDQFHALLDTQLGIVPSIFRNLTIALEEMFFIYANNATLAVLSGAVGVLSGLIKIPLFFIYAVNAALHWGVFTGLLVRNAIAAGSGVLAPFIGVVGTIGFLFLSHTIHEFIAIVGVGMFASYVGAGVRRLVLSESGARKLILRGVVYAVVLELGIHLAIASLFEVGLDPFVTGWAIGSMTIPSSITSYGPGYPYLAVVSSVIAIFSLGLLAVSTVRLLIWLYRPVFQGGENRVS